MPSYSLPTLGDLVKAIKLESRLAGTTDMDEMVINTINELLLEYCYNGRYMEFLQLNFSISTFDATGLYGLPQDFQHIANIRYQNNLGGRWTLYPRKTNLYLSNPSGKRPRFYDINGQVGNNPQINLIPFDGIAVGDTILIDYYSLPPILQDQENDIFPIARLVGPLKQKAIYRMINYNITQGQPSPTAGSFKQDSIENEYRAKPSG